MSTCPSCAEENPDRAKFCLNCGTALSGTARPREERKIVTVLFCDLVGFTARSDRADPEDVKAVLRPFHARLKREIELHGGTLDKFIGDAGLGVFGSPVAHEDDPERAVRAGLAILDAIAELNDAHPELNLAVRIGINTGEAVVAYGAGPQIGEAVTGDVVNTASRLQSVAPVNGVLVGEPTFRATERSFLFEALPAVTVKGKADALPVWVVREARARLGVDVARSPATPYVGRDAELRTLRDALDRAVGDRAVHLVSVVGEPGLGKSRLVAELGRHVDRHPGMVVWRQGRCLPYGEGITFWALGEIVKAHAGILESDPAEAVAAKLDAVIPEAEADREWMRRRLAPLVGLEAAPADREESFAAWRRFLEGVAAADPTVLVVEDLHWADPALLAFLEHVAREARAVPLLLLCTARPELYGHHSSWAEGIPNHTAVSLAPLSVEETSKLVAALLDHAVLPAEVHAVVLERAGGNPLYAEEFVRMLGDRELLVERGGTLALAEGAEVPFPESIQALIAARLDLLAPDRKALLQDAAVVGKVFWSGPLAAMGDRAPAEVADVLEELVRRELIRPSRVSSMEGESEFGFWHVLVRDVAYGQIPRAARAVKHRAVAAWIEESARGRVEDHAGILAHHYTRALRLAEACGEVGLASELEGPALRFLVAAGDRALGLDVAGAEMDYDRALDLASPGHLERPAVLVRWAEAARQAGRFPEAAAALEEAIAAFRERGDGLAAARALGVLSSIRVSLGGVGQEEPAAEAVALLEREPPGSDLVAAYARMSGVNVVLGLHRAAIEWADRAVAVAGEHGLDVPPRALGFRGYGRASLGDAAGLRDMRDALAGAVERGEGRDAAVLYNNLAVAVTPIEGPASAAAVLREGVEFSERRGITEMADAMRAASLDVLTDLGEWDQALELAETLGERADAIGDAADLIQVRWVRCRILARRGEVQGALSLADWLVDAARASGATEDVTAGFSAAALAYAGAGWSERAHEVMEELARTPNIRESPIYPAYLPDLVRLAIDLGEVEMAGRLSEGSGVTYPYGERALRATDAALAEALGELGGAADGYAEAASEWEAFGVVPERAFALLGRGRCLVGLGRTTEAAPPLREARALFVRLGAHPSVAEADELLVRTAALNS